MKGKKIGILIGVSAVVIAVGASVTVTQQNEYKLIRQFGKVDRVISSSGISFKIPFIESTQSLPKETLLYDLAASDVITKDKKTMISDSYVLWKISDPLKFAQTLNSSVESGEIQYENFNAAKAVVEFAGVNVHPGSSKNTMVNAALVAMEFNSMLPSADTPRDTEDYEGFFHLYSIKGDVSHATLEYIIRDHDAASFDVRKKSMEHITKILNEKWGKGTVSLTITEQYRNMKEIIDTCMELIEHATAACKECNISPLITPIRGGTDGAQLSFMGLPCPNLGTGGHAYHGPYEHITVEGMDIAVEVGLKIIELFYK